MSLGTKLQSVHNKVNTKLGTQDSAVTFRKHTIVKNAEFGRPYTSNTNSDVTISAGIKIARVKSYETDAAGTVKLGDLKFTVPAGLITEAQLTGAEILYGPEKYSIVSMAPTEIFGGVPVNWLVIGRLKVG